jgi:hypothetical protein
VKFAVTAVIAGPDIPSHRIIADSCYRSICMDFKTNIELDIYTCLDYDSNKISRSLSCIIAGSLDLTSLSLQ